MYKTKIFNQSIDVEEKMNKWFEENSSIKIVSVTQSSAMTNHNILYTTIVVVYKKLYNKPDTGPR